MKHTKYYAFLLLLLSFFAFSTASFAQLDVCSVFFDDFEDGDLLAPDWADSNGTASVVAGQVTASSDTVLSSAVTATTTADVLEFGFDASIAADEALVMTISGTDGNNYSISLTNGVVNLLANGGIILSGAAATDQLHTLRATRTAGTWELFVDGGSAGTAADPFGTADFNAVSLVLIGSPVADNVDIVADCVSGVNSPPVAEDFEVITVEDTAVSFSFLDHASDPNGDPLTVIIDTDVQAGSLTVDEFGGATFTPDAEWGGAVSATYHVNDGEFDSNIATVYIWVLPVNDPPNCDALATDVSTLWPPNHKMVPVSIDEGSVSDPDSTSFDIVLTGISSDEPENGLGDGDTDTDWDVDAGEVRAERSGTGDGRIYTISASVDDTNWTGTYENLTGNPAYDYSEDILIDGGSCEGSATVDVPHDQGKGNDNSDDNDNGDEPPAPETGNGNGNGKGNGSDNAHGNNPHANPHAAKGGDNGKGSNNSNNSNTALPSDTGNGNGKSNGKSGK